MTLNDPWGMALTLGLVVKETPFLLLMALAAMTPALRHRQRVAATLGYGRGVGFALVVWPSLYPALRLPVLAVLAYGLTVVDMALIIGPASPPTLAVLAWQWLIDADLLTQSQGVAAAGWLTGTVLVTGVLMVVALHELAATRLFASRGSLLQKTPAWVRHFCRRLPLQPNVMWTTIVATYAAVWFALTVGSVSGVWPFPQVWPELLTLSAWQQVASSAHTVWTTLGLGVASASVCLLWSVAWLELAPRRWQQAMQPWFLLPLVLPSVLWVVGLYSLALHTRLEGQWLGLSLAHAVMVLPYVLLALVPAYQAVDPRQAVLVASLGRGRWVYLWRVKWPLLKRAIASAWAVGFAVSVAQYLPTLYVGAGRFATVTTEAVTLAAGAQRSLMSAYAALQMLLPIAAFALAAWLGRPRRFEKIAPMKATP